MIFAWLGAALCVVSLFTGIWAVAVVGMGFILAAMLFSYRPPQDDPVWKLLVRDGVIEDGDEDYDWDDAYREHNERLGDCGLGQP